MQNDSMGQARQIGPAEPGRELPWELPRRFAIRLLHAAQSAGERPFNALVTSTGKSSVPDQMVMIDQTDVLPRTVSVDSGAAPWAVYLYRPGQSSAPAPLDFTALPQVLRLTASLAIKGVLQLHAWRCIDGVVSEVPLRIAD